CFGLPTHLVPSPRPGVTFLREFKPGAALRALFRRAFGTEVNVGGPTQQTTRARRHRNQRIPPLPSSCRSAAEIEPEPKPSEVRDSVQQWTSPGRAAKSSDGPLAFLFLSGRGRFLRGAGTIGFRACASGGVGLAGQGAMRRSGTRLFFEAALGSARSRA